MADEIEIVDYDAHWPRLFEEERAALEQVLPSDQVLAIEHAGSTAIPGLAAKPIIDIFIAVPSIEVAKATLVVPIKAIGYVYWAENPDLDSHVLRQRDAALRRAANPPRPHPRADE
jgi:GrpB-like predicted nucleotidyltransferase (UPF0157 family)